MIDAEKLAGMVLENEEEPASTPPGPAERAEAGEDISQMSAVDKWKGALDTFRKVRELRKRQAKVEDDLEFAIAYRHALAKVGLTPDDVRGIIRRSQHEHGQEYMWRNKLKRQKDTRWKEATIFDIIGVDTKDGRTVTFDEWIQAPQLK